MKRPFTRPSAGTVALWVVLILVLVMIIAAASAIKTRKKEEPNGDAVEKLVSVRTRVLSAGDVADTINLPGRIESRERAVVAAEKPGRVARIVHDRGDRVRKGNLLMQIDASVWDAHLKRAKIEQDDADRSYARWEKLKATGDVSGSEFDQVRMRRDLAGVAVQEASVHVENCEVRSPVSGTVNARLIEEGEYANEGQAVFEVVNTDALKVVLNVPEQDVDSVQTEASMRFSVASLDEQIFTGTVSFVAVDAGRTKGTFATELRVDGQSTQLRPGMIASVQLDRGVREGCVAVPLSAVIPKRGEDIVFVIVDGRAIQRVVRIDAIIGNTAILVAGVSPGEQLVIEGQRTLQDGMAVESTTE